jgi:hypothetical protein
MPWRVRLQSIDRPVVHIRILGKSELMRIEACSSIFLNGNNITVVGDLCRRTITIATREWNSRSCASSKATRFVW